MELDSLLARLTLTASDLHLVAGSPPIFRIAGDLVPDPTPLTPDDLDRLLQTALPSDKLAAARQGHDFPATLRRGDQDLPLSGLPRARPSRRCPPRSAWPPADA